ncbi:hypothetical protein BKA56DRAFT_611922 [Ilyonectria sp. MPI-CAGE-AT-0026]|nr:hypothetical protein BKA56DRAFT_611922 [Ilyonectria sp. MPI-CAGE-AT-0026]
MPAKSIALFRIFPRPPFALTLFAANVYPVYITRPGCPKCPSAGITAVSAVLERPIANHQPPTTARCPPPRQPQEEEEEEGDDDDEDGDDEDNDEDEDDEMETALSSASLAGPQPLTMVVRVAPTMVTPSEPSKPTARTGSARTGSARTGSVSVSGTTAGTVPAASAWVVGYSALRAALVVAVSNSLLTEQGRAFWTGLWALLFDPEEGWLTPCWVWVKALPVWGWIKALCCCCCRRHRGASTVEDGSESGTNLRELARTRPDPVSTARSDSVSVPGTTTGTVPAPTGTRSPPPPPSVQPRSSGMRPQVQPLGQNLGQAFIRPGKAISTGFGTRAPRGLKIQ